MARVQTMEAPITHASGDKRRINIYDCEAMVRQYESLGGLIVERLPGIETETVVMDIPMDVQYPPKEVFA